MRAGNPLQEGAAVDQPHRPRRRQRLAGRQHPADDAVLHLHLQPLRGAGRKRAPALNAPRDRRASASRRATGAASMLAAATASWIARLMPTPPTGDIACAASPMQSRPGRYHCRRRSTLTVRSLMSSQLASSPTRSCSMRRDLDDGGAEGVETRGPHLFVTVLRDHVGALPVVAAVDHDEHLAGDRSGRAARRRPTAGASAASTARRSARRCRRP